jgi:hypothetical protein
MLFCRSKTAPLGNGETVFILKTVQAFAVFSRSFKKARPD